MLWVINRPVLPESLPAAATSNPRDMPSTPPDQYFFPSSPSSTLSDPALRNPTTPQQEGEKPTPKWLQEKIKRLKRSPESPSRLSRPPILPVEEEGRNMELDRTDISHEMSTGLVFRIAVNQDVNPFRRGPFLTQGHGLTKPLTEVPQNLRRGKTALQLISPILFRVSYISFIFSR